MARLQIYSGEEVCKILSRHGFALVRQRGSHFVMQKKLPASTITVPIPNHKEIRIGTLKAIIKQSQIPPTEFEQ